MKKFGTIAKTFADKLCDRNFVSDVNFTLAALAKLSKNSEVVLSKDEVVESANKTQYYTIGCFTEAETFDDIFKELSSEKLVIINNLNTSRMSTLQKKEKLNRREKKELKQLENEFNNPEIGFNEIRLTEDAIQKINEQYKEVLF